jgi:hypothetical protein
LAPQEKEIAPICKYQRRAHCTQADAFLLFWLIENTTSEMSHGTIKKMAEVILVTLHTTVMLSVSEKKKPAANIVLFNASYAF